MRKERKYNIYIIGNMNFHIFVAIITCMFYVFLRIYKTNVLDDKKNKSNKSKSNFLYILFIPIVLYITHFLYYKCNEKMISDFTSIKHIEKPNSLQISEDLLSIPYPESSFRSSNLN